MRPVNLLPQQHRPRTSGGLSGSAYVVLAVLALLLVGTALYVMTSNQVKAHKQQALEAKQDADEAEAELATLGSFGDFKQVTATRLTAVSELANGRFDWERFLRELAHVLPSEVWLTVADATVESTEEGASSSESSEAQPGARLEGCARRQSDVATLMVRLRDLHKVHDATLQESTRGESESSDSESSGGCGRYYSFKVTAVFDVAETGTGPTERPGTVPASLGGGQ
jgi:Tfp pilus assembly protein PilN